MEERELPLQPQCNLAALSGKKFAIRKSLGQVAAPFPGDNYNAISMFSPQSDLVAFSPLGVRLNWLRPR